MNQQSDHQTLISQSLAYATLFYALAMIMFGNAEKLKKLNSNSNANANSNTNANANSGISNLNGATNNKHNNEIKQIICVSV